MISLGCISLLQSQSPKETDKGSHENARTILKNVIYTLQSSQNYAVDLHCKAQIYDTFFSGKGMFCQKRQSHPITGLDRISARWEMEYYFPTFSHYTLSVLNGEQMKLWRVNEQRSANDTNSEKTIVSEIKLDDVLKAINSQPTRYRSLPEPWYTQPHIGQLLQGIHDSYYFTTAYVRQVENFPRHIYHLCGVLKPEIVKKILEVRSISVPEEIAVTSDGFSENAPILSLLPKEIPTYVEIYLDYEQGFPYFIRFFQRTPTEEGLKTSQTSDFQVSISFENTYLNNATLNPSFFEVPKNSTKRFETDNFLLQFLLPE